jgi:hypothetical protein
VAGVQGVEAIDREGSLYTLELLGEKGVCMLGEVHCSTFSHDSYWPFPP